MSWSATLEDLFTFGLPGATAAPETRQILSVDAATDEFELPGHALFGGEGVRIRPATTGTLPTGLSSRTRYTVATPDDSDFFSLLLAGSPVSLSDTGSGVLTLLVDITPKLTRIVQARSSYLVARAKAYAGPWDTPPGWAPQTAAILAAYDVAAVLRVSSPQYSLEDLRTRAEKVEAWIAGSLDKGVPMSDGVGPIDATPAQAEMGSVSVSLKGRGFLRAEDEREDLA